MKFYLLLFLILFLIINPVHSKGAGATSAAFLKIGVGAEAAGAGGAYTTLAEGALGMYWNPAGISETKNNDAYFYHNQWFADIKQEFVAFAKKISDDVTAGISYNYLSVGEIDRIEINNMLPVNLGVYKAYSYAFSAGIAKKFEDISAGLVLKLINEKIDSYSDQAYAFDFGVNYIFKDYDLKTALAVFNVGSKIKLNKEAYKLPLTFKAGASYKFVLNKFNILLSADLIKIVDDDLSYCGGLIFELPYEISVRTGYNDLYDIGKKYTLGFGKIFNLNNNISFDVNYAYLPADKVENAHNFSLRMKW